MWALIGLFVGALVGRALFGEWGTALFALIGFFVGLMASSRHRRDAFRKPADAGAAQRRATAPAEVSAAAVPALPAAIVDRVRALELRVAELERAAGVASPRSPFEASEAPATTLPSVEAGEVAATAPPADTGPAQDAAFAPSADGTLQTVRVAADAQSAQPAAMPATDGRTASAAASASPGPASAREPNAAWAWFTGGDTLTRIGVVVLFFGVAFLLRYFAEHFTIPLELRLLGVALAGAAVMGLGVWLEPRRPAYGVSLQALGAGVLYLTTFAAFRLYDVLPATPALVLLVVVSALTVALALRSDSMPLAALAFAGGFLAPVLAGGGGGPAPLFAYFAVLNGAVFALAWTRAWRALNALGFVFTFALSVLWGARYYRPEHFAVVEPFLALFVAFYIAIAILETKRTPLTVTDPVHGLLVFGVPIVAFALQAMLVRDERYGLAWSAFGFAVVYAALALALRARNEPGLALLRRAFGALAVIFGTLAVPFAFDDRWTSALWAVEAAGVYWLGVRQRSAAARAFALLVEVGAGALFALDAIEGFDGRLFLNAGFFGAMLIALSGLAIARFADLADPPLSEPERAVPPLWLGWGALWWLAAGVLEIHRVLPAAQQSHAMLGWIVAAVALAIALPRPLRWPRLALVAFALLPLMLVAAVVDFERARTTLTHFGWLVWPAAWVLQLASMRVAASEPVVGFVAGGRAGRWPPLASLHAVTAFALVAQLCWEASEWVGRVTPEQTVWVACAAALPAIAYVALARYVRADWRWPLGPYENAYATSAAAPIAGLVTIWFFLVNVLSPGDAAPLPYAPLANPLDLSLALAAVAVFAWARKRMPGEERAHYAALGAALFVALNGIVMRTAHHFGDIPWRLGSLLASKPLQAALTLTWSATALVLMFMATRRALRPLWMVGAGLLAIVVGKLFLVDLASLSGLPRVVAFLGVGALLLVIGYVAPLPPAARDGDQA